MRAVRSFWDRGGGWAGAGGVSREGRSAEATLNPRTRLRALGRWRVWSATWATGGRGQPERGVQGPEEHREEAADPIILSRGAP